MTCLRPTCHRGLVGTSQSNPTIDTGRPGALGPTVLSWLEDIVTRLVSSQGRGYSLLVHSTNSLSDFQNFFRRPAHLSRHLPPPADVMSGTNPLLLPQARREVPRNAHSQLVRLGITPNMIGGLGMGMGVEPLAFISDLVQHLPDVRLSAAGGPLALHFTADGPGGIIRELNAIPIPPPHARESRSTEARRDTYQEPHQAVQFSLESTHERWQQEVKMIFGFGHQDKAQKLAPLIISKLTPAAIQAEKEEKARKAEADRKAEEERKKRQEEERKKREAKEAEEKAAREKKEAEERERLERERAEAAAQAAAQAAADQEANAAAQEATSMEGVETQAAGENAEQQAEDERPRVYYTLRNQQVDITELGIDAEYLEALPEEFRDEVIAQAISTRRSQAREQVQQEGENTEVFQEFLEALPEELRNEILHQEQHEQRRRERQAAAGGQDLGPADMDPASILLTFPPGLRQQVLLDQGEDIMEHLGPELAAEARTLVARHRQLHAAQGGQPAPRPRDTQRPAEAGARAVQKVQRRTVVQMLDKQGIATLLRLMFVSQQGSIRSSLFNIFANLCENRQNRLDVISSLLQVLQDGCTNMDAIERSFAQISYKAKQPKEKDAKTPHPLKRTLTGGTSNNNNNNTNAQFPASSEVSPLLIVQQCLDLLVELTKLNAHVPSVFLTEHETVASTLKRSLSRKGKGKDVTGKAPKFAINSLLTLLDRNLVMESSAVMQVLADLLNKITIPLQAIERRRKEFEEETKKKKEAEEKAASEREAAANAPEEQTSTEQASSAQQEVTQQPSESAPAAGSSEQPAQPDQENKDPEAPKEQAGESSLQSASEEKKFRTLTPPTIPEHNLKLVINIFVARECSSKTFQNTISTIKNLSNIPGAKKVFGDELVRQARVLSENILSDLDNLLPHILKAESGTQIQGVALAKFSPGASEQNKLLRVLTALDHLFDSKSKKQDKPAEGENTKEDLLGSLYWNPTFGTMWDKLSACLSAIRQRDNMLNVATILLPLIESLMVVCKNTTLSDASAVSNVNSQKEMLLTSPPPEDRIAGLFFTFTEEHRRILNELVRHNPKLMSGTFSLLVKNPKVLEFDNKRNYFNRSVHSKHQQTRQSFPPLQLQVRREHVFHDSFRSLYYKKAEELKFGKLNIRFQGEEGVDAGGVTREWFQVLSRQMFDPNYVLFVPVSSDRTTFHPNKLSPINDEHLPFFKFIGRIIGKALYEGRLLDCYFSRAVYKRILGKPVSVKDMESFDPDYYKSLVWMLENDITDIITETFSVEDDVFGEVKVVDLIENGRNIPVTEENKHEYVRLIVEHKLITSVKDQMKAFLTGKFASSLSWIITHN